MIKNFLVLFLCFWVMLVSAYTRIDQVPLTSLDGKKVYLGSVSANKATVIIFLSPECPLCQSYTLTVNNLIKDYSSQKIDFVGVVPGKDDAVADIKKYIRSYKASIRVLRDEDNKLVKYLGASITPEAFVIDKNGKIVYSGRIDNWAYELGKKRKIITEHNLKDAIESVLHNQSVKVTKTRAVGCFIE